MVWTDRARIAPSGGTPVKSVPNLRVPLQTQNLYPSVCRLFKYDSSPWSQFFGAVYTDFGISPWCSSGLTRITTRCYNML